MVLPLTFVSLSPRRRLVVGHESVLLSVYEMWCITHNCARRHVARAAPRRSASNRTFGLNERGAIVPRFPVIFTDFQQQLSVRAPRPSCALGIVEILKRDS